MCSTTGRPRPMIACAQPDRRSNPAPASATSRAASNHALARRDDHASPRSSHRATKQHRPHEPQQDMRGQKAQTIRHAWSIRRRVRAPRSTQRRHFRHQIVHLLPAHTENTTALPTRSGTDARPVLPHRTCRTDQIRQDQPHGKTMSGAGQQEPDRPPMTESPVTRAAVWVQSSSSRKPRHLRERRTSQRKTAQMPPKRKTRPAKIAAGRRATPQKRSVNSAGKRCTSITGPLASTPKPNHPQRIQCRGQHPPCPIRQIRPIPKHRQRQQCVEHRRAPIDHENRNVAVTTIARSATAAPAGPEPPGQPARCDHARTAQTGPTSRPQFGHAR